jgi:hypothetical protein
MGGFAALDGTKLTSGSFNNSAQVAITGAGTDGATESGALTVMASGSNVRDSDALLVALGWVTSGRAALVDIGIGAGPTWVINDLPVNGGRGAIAPNVYAYLLPLHIPSGIAISARARITGGTAKGLGVTVHQLSGVFIGGPGGGLSKVDVYGTQAGANARGTDLDPGGTANTKSAWANGVLSTSTARDMKMCYVVMGNGGSTTNAATDWLLDIGVGAAASEQVILPNLYFSLGGQIGSGPTPFVLGPFPVNVPSGSRLVARVQSGNTTAASRVCDVTVVGMS